MALIILDPFEMRYIMAILHLWVLETEGCVEFPFSLSNQQKVLQKTRILHRGFDEQLYGF